MCRFVVKVGCYDCGRWANSLERGFDALALTLLTQTPTPTRLHEPERVVAWSRDKRVRAAAGSERWHKNKLILGTRGPRQRSRTKPQDALHVCEPHLESSCAHAAMLETIRAANGPGQVSRVLMDGGDFTQQSDSSYSSLWSSTEMSSVAV